MMLDPKEITEGLGQDRSKRAVDLWVDRLAKEHFDLATYLDVVLTTEPPVNWYLTWTLNHYFDRYPHLGLEKQRMLWERLRSIEHKGIKRDLWRILSSLELDEDLAGEVFERGILIVRSSAQEVAVRAHAMKVLLNVTKNYPELVDELDLILNDLMIDASAGVKARAKNYRKEIKKIKALQ